MHKSCKLSTCACYRIEQKITIVLLNKDKNKCIADSLCLFISVL